MIRPSLSYEACLAIGGKKHDRPSAAMGFAGVSRCARPANRLSARWVDGMARLCSAASKHRMVRHQSSRSSRCTLINNAGRNTVDIAASLVENLVRVLRTEAAAQKLLTLTHPAGVLVAREVPDPRAGGMKRARWVRHPADQARRSRLGATLASMGRVAHD